MKYTYNILLIGAGNIGSRHLQSIAKLNCSVNLFVVDNKKSSLYLAKKRFNSIQKKIEIKSISFLTDLNNVSSKIELAIISTNANIRKKLIEVLLNNKRVKYLIIEKVCFQSIQQFKAIIQLTKKKNTKVWANLAKRTFPIYRKIKQKINKEKKIYINFSSGNFDLGCNTIHLLDILSFLSGSMIKEVNMSLVDKKIYKSKRKGYIDFNGTLKVDTCRGDEMIITNYRNINKPETLEIHSDNYYFFIDSELKKIKFYKKRNQKLKHYSSSSFIEPYQSQITHLYINNILKYGDCNLPNLNEAYKLHKPMLISFLKHIKKYSKKNAKLCNIT